VKGQLSFLEKINAMREKRNAVVLSTGGFSGGLVAHSMGDKNRKYRFNRFEFFPT
jgi:hypothetical protein